MSNPPIAGPVMIQSAARRGRDARGSTDCGTMSGGSHEWSGLERPRNADQKHDAKIRSRVSQLLSSRAPAQSRPAFWRPGDGDHHAPVAPIRHLPDENREQHQRQNCTSPTMPRSAIVGELYSCQPTATASI
jgi:hypothetical protein